MITYQRHLRPSIVRMQDGTGFWVKGRNGKRYVLTCTHVLEDNKAIEIRLFDGKESFEKNVRAKLLAQISVKEGDVSLLEVAEKDIPGDCLALQLLDISFSEPPPFQAFGFPEAFSEHGRPAHGTIVNTATSNDRVPLLQLNTDMDIRQGFSGAPVVHAQMGYVLGMVSDGEEPSPRKADLNPYALPAKFIAEKLQEYLEVQTLHPYQAWLASLYHDVVLGDEKGMRLSDVYVAANCGVHEFCVDKTDSSYKSRTAKNGFFPTGANIHDIVEGVLLDKENKPHKTNKPALTLLLGYPGQGKTSFTKRLIHDSITQNPEHAVYLVRLRYITDTRALLNNPFQVLEQEIMHEGKIETGDSLIVNFNNALLVLDGLDELSIKSDMSSRDVDDIVQEIWRNTEKFPGLRVILTARYGYAKLEKLANRNILVLQLSEFEPQHQKSWLKAYRIFHPESHLTEAALKTYQEEGKYKVIRELITQPILLQMVATLEDGLAGGDNRAAIYTKLFDQLVARAWDKGGNIATLRGLNPEMLRHALQDIAHAIFHAEKGYLYKSDLHKLPKVKALETALDNKIDIWRSVMVAFYMDEVRKSSSRENEGDRDHDFGLEFLHKSLYEYLCAEKIWRSITEEFEKPPKKAEYGLESLYDIFGHKVLSIEIVKYLIEIIRNDELADKQELSKNVTLWMNDWLDCDFLSTKGVGQPLDSISAVFYGFWTVLSHLREGENYFNDENRTRLVQLIRLVSEGDNWSYFNLSGANLAGASLGGANLDGVNLSCANLANTYLYGASLGNANLSGAVLTRATLYRASLFKADLSDSNLSEANLGSANLSGTNMTRTNLERVNFINAYMGESIFEHDNYLDEDVVGTILDDALLSRTILIEARGLTAMQLQNVKTLYTSAIPLEIESTLRKTHPHLFEKPEWLE